MLIYVNGQIVPQEEAKVSVFDHGFLYGDGAFEGIRAYNGRVYRLYDHVDRLFRSAHHLAIPVPLDREGLAQAILETARANKIQNGYIRVTMTRGLGLGLDPKNIKNPTLVIIANELALYPKDLYENGLELMTVSVRTTPSQCIEPRIKSLGKYINNILAKLESNRTGAGEALMLTVEGHVAEASGDNIFLARGGELLTPPGHVGILEGITRATTMEIAAKMEIPIKEQMLTLYDVYNAEECFLTGTAAELIPVAKVDGRAIGNGKPGPLTQRISAAFREYVQSVGEPIY